MEAKLTELKKKLADSLKRAAEIACQIQTLEQGSGIPHYDQIEIPAHEVGQQLSRLVQEQQAGEVAVRQSGEADCPDCGRACRCEVFQRTVHSMDGPVELLEIVAECRPCRRSFFPSA